jgi:hypothetical protein
MAMSPFAFREMNDERRNDGPTTPTDVSGNRNNGIYETAA